MPMSYYDLAVSPVAVQQAAADTLQQQVAGNLAVRPKLSLRSALQDAQQQRQSAQQLALGERRLGLGGERLGLDKRRLALTEDQLDYSNSARPWQIGIGALNAGLNIYGGFRGLAEQENRQAQYAEQAGILSDIRAQQTRATDTQVATQGKLRQLLEGQGYPAYNYP